MQATPSRVSILPGREVRGRVELTRESAVVSVTAICCDYRDAAIGRFQQLARVIDPHFHQQLFGREMKHFTGQTFEGVDRY